MTKAKADIKFNREEAINKLIKVEIENINDRTLWHYLYNGVVGYKDMADEEIEEEYNNLN